MKVSQLIAELQKLPQDAQVVLNGGEAFNDNPIFMLHAPMHRDKLFVCNPKTGKDGLAKNVVVL